MLTALSSIIFGKRTINIKKLLGYNYMSIGMVEVFLKFRKNRLLSKSSIIIIDAVSKY